MSLKQTVQCQYEKSMFYLEFAVVRFSTSFANVLNLVFGIVSIIATLSIIPEGWFTNPFNRNYVGKKEGVKLFSQINGLKIITRT